MARRKEKYKFMDQSQVQQYYHVALAAYNNAIEERNRQFEPPNVYLLETEARIDEFMPIEEKIETRLQIQELRKALHEAEDALIKWAIKKIKSDSVASVHLAEIGRVAKVALSGKIPSVRSQVINLSVRMVG